MARWLIDPDASMGKGYFPEQYMRQLQEAGRLMQAYTDYAVSLGCETFQDEITVHTAEQKRLLSKWWKDHTS